MSSLSLSFSAYFLPLSCWGLSKFLVPVPPIFSPVSTGGAEETPCLLLTCNTEIYCQWFLIRENPAVSDPSSAALRSHICARSIPKRNTALPVEAVYKPALTNTCTCSFYFTALGKKLPKSNAVLLQLSAGIQNILIFFISFSPWTILGLANSLAILTRSQAYAVVLLPLREKRFLCGAETSTNMLLYKSTLLTPAMKLSTWMPSGHSKLVLWNQWKSMQAWQHDSPSHVPHHAQSRSSSLWKMCIEMTPSKRSSYWPMLHFHFGT